MYEGLPEDLAEAIREGYARRDRANMDPTISYFQQLHEQ